MGVQEIVALSIVSITAALFAWNRLRPRKFKFTRGNHCGCAAVGHTGHQPSILFQARKGEASRVVIKAN
jgi:hypothetical protein